jgi:hypothetical protein
MLAAGRGKSKSCQIFVRIYLDGGIFHQMNAEALTITDLVIALWSIIFAVFIGLRLNRMTKLIFAELRIETSSIRLHLSILAVLFAMTMPGLFIASVGGEFLLRHIANAFVNYLIMQSGLIITALSINFICFFKLVLVNRKT